MNDYVDLLDATTVSESELPNVISTQFDNIVELERHVTDSVNLAAKAKQKAENAQVSAGLFKKKEAIELLQSATEEQSNALISLADAQKLSFEYQRKLTEISQFLFGLGVSNLAMNRSTYQQIELKLKGASEEELSNLAKRELRNVLLQLRQQQDMLERQEKLSGKVKEQAGHIKSINKQLVDIGDSNNRHDQNIAANTERIEQHSKELELQQKKDEELAKAIAEQDLTDKIHDEELSKHALVLSVQQKKDQEQDSRILANAKRIVEIESVLDRQHQRDEEIECKTDENFRKIQKLELSLKEQLLEQETKNQVFGNRIIELQNDLSKEFDDLRHNLEQRNSKINNDISLCEEKADKQISDLREDVRQAFEDYEEKHKLFSEQVQNAISQLRDELDMQNAESHSKVEELERKITSLETEISKKAWKIAVSVIASVSLLLNFLQLLGVI